MHMIDPSCNLLFESAIVGGAAPLAVGAALAASRRGTGAVAMTIFGEGATAQGSIHESINLAGALKLPVIFILENNRYSEMTPASDTSALADFSWRALGHGVPALSSDGNSVPIMRSATRSALEWSRSGRGPVLIEARTYRLVGHYGGDPGAYRPPGELEEAERREPIGRAGEELINAGASENDLQRVRDEVEQEVEDAVNFALESPLSDPAGVAQHVYKEES
jgi:pyruvate dehydrogenase E1 component alpha subunit